MIPARRILDGVAQADRPFVDRGDEREVAVDRRTRGAGGPAFVDEPGEVLGADFGKELPGPGRGHQRPEAAHVGREGRARASMPRRSGSDLRSAYGSALAR